MTILTALSIWEAFFSLSKQFYKSSWLIFSDRLVHPLKDSFLMHPTLPRVELAFRAAGPFWLSSYTGFAVPLELAGFL